MNTLMSLSEPTALAISAAHAADDGQGKSESGG